MVQGIFGGGTSYEGQSISDIKKDIDSWKVYTENIKSQIVEKKEALVKNGFWNKIPWNFQQIINDSIFCLGTFFSDFQIIESAFEANFITEREVKLLRKIGKNSVGFNHDYGKYFKEEYEWRDYGNPEFEIAESIYQHGRDFFVTLQDASNAAGRLEDYMNNNSISNKVTIFGNSYNTNIQQGQQNNMSLSTNDVSELLSKLDFLMDNLQNNLPEDEINDAREYIETIKDEVIKEKPKRKILRFAVDSLKDLKWSMDLLASIATISQFVMPLL